MAQQRLPAPLHQTIQSILAWTWDQTVGVVNFDQWGTHWHEVLSQTREYYHLLLASPLPVSALQRLANSASWDHRYLVALHDQTPWDLRQVLSQDGNRYVRAMARAKAALIQDQNVSGKI